MITALYFLFPKNIIGVFWGSTFVGATPYLGLFGIFISLVSISSLLIMVCLAAARKYVWVPTIIASVFQIFLITRYHSNLYAVTKDNIIVSLVLLVSLLLYFAYEKKRT